MTDILQIYQMPIFWHGFLFRIWGIMSLCSTPVQRREVSFSAFDSCYFKHLELDIVLSSLCIMPKGAIKGLFTWEATRRDYNSCMNSYKHLPNNWNIFVQISKSHVGIVWNWDSLASINVIKKASYIICNINVAFD